MEQVEKQVLLSVEAVLLSPITKYFHSGISYICSPESFRIYVCPLFWELKYADSSSSTNVSDEDVWTNTFPHSIFNFFSWKSNNSFNKEFFIFTHTWFKNNYISSLGFSTLSKNRKITIGKSIYNNKFSIIVWIVHRISLNLKWHGKESTKCHHNRNDNYQIFQKVFYLWNKTFVLCIWHECNNKYARKNNRYIL